MLSRLRHFFETRPVHATVQCSTPHVATLARSCGIVDDGDLRRCGRPRGTGHRGQDVAVAMDLTRTEQESAVQHFYRMELTPGLFGDWVRERGRAGQSGQIRIDWFDEEVQVCG